MGFRFPLQSLLRLRTTIEERELLRLQASAAAIARARTAIERLRSVVEATRISRTLTGNERSAAELQHDTDCLANLGTVRARMLKNLETLEQHHETQRERYRVARQQREVLECLREQQFAKWKNEESRRQQDAADELALLRRTRPREKATG